MMTKAPEDVNCVVCAVIECVHLLTIVFMARKRYIIVLGIVMEIGGPKFFADACGKTLNQDVLR